MPHKDNKTHAEYNLKYYHTHPEYRKAQCDNDRLNYWRKKFMAKFYCSLEDCKKFTEQELREQIKTGVCRV